MRTDRPLPGPDAWHHPHFISIERTPWGDLRWAFRPFTGAEPEPKLPPEQEHGYEGGYDSPEYQAWNWRVREIEAAHDLWKAAQFKAKFRRLIKAVASKWAPLNQARKALDAAYSALDETKAEDWNTALLRLTRARGVALEAAQTWDRDSDVFDLAVHSWQSFRTDHWQELVGSLAENAREAGLTDEAWQADVPDVWDDGHGGYRYSYVYGADGPTEEKIREIIKQQDRELAEVTRLAGLAES